MTSFTCRPYRGTEDLAGMAGASARLRAHLGLLEPIDLAAMEHRYTHLVNSDPLTDCLVAERDGVTVGYARTEWHNLVDGDRIYEITSVVEPGSRGLGIADVLISWCEARLRTIASTLPPDRRCWYSAYAFDGDAETIAALGARGYGAVRWDAEMLRPDLRDPPEVEVPDGYTLRTPAEHELPAVFEMLVAAFDEHWGEHQAQDQRLGEWLDDPRFRRDLVVVAWRGDAPVASVGNVLEPSPDGSVRGLLDFVATHPDHRRRGLARAAIAESLHRLRDARATSAYLGVDTDNHNRAPALYESCGFRVVTRGATYRKAFEPGEDRR